MAGRLEGKVAIITGAGCVGPGWGNGRAECVRFAEEGASIFAVDMSPEPMAETLERVAVVGGEIETHLCDVTNKAQVDAMVEACITRFGRVDILINNVGGSARGGPVEMDEET
ncbi:MAG: SDR family oxidoreductase [Rhodospirillales bacterium]|nr:SDR family oxidoreductase [Rhodospirillales bacterium]